MAPRASILVTLLALAISHPASAEAAKKGPAPGKDALILDIGGDGIDLSASTTTKLLTGKAQKVHWTKANCDEGFLVLDTAGLLKASFKVSDPSGKLTGMVLFRGDVKVVGKHDEYKSNVQASGCVWTVLRDLDSNRDGKLDAMDPTWLFLRVWVDKNADGKIDTGEAVVLADAAVKQITIFSGDEDGAAKADADGNQRIDGELTKTDGKTAVATAVSLAAVK